MSNPYMPRPRRYKDGLFSIRVTILLIGLALIAIGGIAHDASVFPFAYFCFGIWIVLGIINSVTRATWENRR